MARLREEFAARGPWITRFEIDGVALGGEYFAASDARLAAFFARFPAPGRVLELGCLEGGHTVEIARRAAWVVAIDSREANLARARWVQSLLGRSNITFVQANVEEYDVAALGTFDVVFNCGLLYHLPRPRRLLARLAPLTRAMFVWTHVCEEARARTVVDGYRGWLYTEAGHGDPLSGMSPSSFWPSRPELLRMLRETGFTDLEVIADEPGHPHGPAILLACRPALPGPAPPGGTPPPAL